MRGILRMTAVFIASALLAQERVVTPGAAGPNRLDVDVALLADGQSDLRDLRLVDAAGREVAYLIVPPPSSKPKWREGRVLPIAFTKKSSGFEVDFGDRTLIDRLKLGGIATPFLKRARVEGSGDRSRWTLLADATVFDLPDQELRMTEIPFAGGDYRYLRVIWDDRSSAPVIGMIVATAREMPFYAGPEGELIPVLFARRPSEPGKSRFRIALPGSGLPLTGLEVLVASGNVFRGASVTEPRLSCSEVTPAHLGGSTLKRTERDGIWAGDMEIPITRPQGRELDLVIDDGNNPPLAITAVRARLAPQPWIYFESADGAPLRARYGSEAAKAPRYDLEASRPYFGSRKIANASWSKTATPAMIAAPPKVAIPPGGPIEREQFRVSRKLPDTPAGLTVLILDADVLSRSNDLSDVRLADANGRQVPYLVEQRAEPFAVKLPVPPRGTSGRSSVYRFALPYDTWPAGTRLVLTTSARVFDRDVVLRRFADNHRNRGAASINGATWRSADPELLPPPLTFDVPLRGAGGVEVVVDEGDNAPLPIESAQLLLPSSALRFHHPGTPVFLLYGNRRASAPRYDLALLAPRLFGEPAREVPMPAGAASTHPADENGPARKLFWVGIAIAAVVLIVMLVRLLSAETSRAPSDTT